MNTIRKRTTSELCFGALTAVSLAWAVQSQAADAPQSVSVGTKPAGEYKMQDEKFGLHYVVGALAFEDPTNSATARLSTGFIAEVNALGWLPEKSEAKGWYLGPSTGLIYSHVGRTGSNFVGTDSDRKDLPAGGNVVMIPADIKLGYHVMDNVRVSLLAGGNILYRSVKSVMGTGGDAATSMSDDWTIYPNVGAAFDVSVADNVAVSFRPDVTITPGIATFNGSVGVGVSLN